MNGKRIAALCILGLLLGTGTGLWLGSLAWAADKVRIGLFAPLTGDWAEQGFHLKSAATLAVEEINHKGGVNGKPVELVIADTRGDNRECVLIAEKYVADPAIVAVVGEMSSSCSMAAAPIFERANVTQISPTASAPKFTEMGKNMFRANTMQSQEGPANAQWAVKDLGAKKIATIYINNDFGVAGNKYFVEEAQRLGAQVVAQEGFTPGERDFTAILTRIKGLGPDTLYISAYHPDGAAILTQAKRMRFEPRVLATAGLESPDLIKLGGSAVEGVMISSQFFPDASRPANWAFSQEFRKRFGKDPTMFSGLTYDATNILVAAIRQVGTEDRAKVREALEGLHGFSGVTGTISYEKSHNPEKSYTRIVVKGGKWTAYQP
jgi:branched-chain amino acid transport system substrate-binding protein